MRVLTVLFVRLVAEEEVPLCRRKHFGSEKFRINITKEKRAGIRTLTSTRIVEEELVEQSSQYSSWDVGERGDSGVSPTTGFSSPKRQRCETSAHITRRVRRESVRCETPNDDSVSEADRVGHHERWAEEVRRVDASPDCQAEEEVLDRTRQ